MNDKRFTRKAIVTMLITASIGSVTAYADDIPVSVSQSANEAAQDEVAQRTLLVNKTAKKVADVRAALMAYYSDKLAWPAPLSAMVTAGYYPTADWSTPFGNITGAVSGNNYVLSLVLPNGTRASPIGKLIAAKADGTVTGTNNTNLTFTLGTPSQATLVKNMLSRVSDPANPNGNTMETALNLGGNNILNIGQADIQVINGGSVNVTGKTTTNELDVAGASVLKGTATIQNKLTVTGGSKTSGLTEVDMFKANQNGQIIGTFSVGGKSTLADVDVNNLLVKGSNTVNGVTTLNGAANLKSTLNVTGKTTLDDVESVDSLVKGTHSVNGVSTLNGATVVRNSLNVTGPSTLADSSITNLVVQGTQENKGSMLINGTTSLKGATLVQNKLTVTGGAKLSGLSEIDELQVNQNANFVGNLSAGGISSLSDLNAKNVLIKGTNTVSGTSSLNGATTVNSTLNVAGKTTLADAEMANVLVKGTQTVNGSSVLKGATTVNSTLNVTGKTTLADAEMANVLVKGAQTVNGSSVLNGATTIKNTLNVTGMATLADIEAVNALIKGNHTVNGISTLNGATTVNDDLSVTGKTSLADTSVNNLTVKGNQTVVGATVLNGSLSAGQTTVSGMTVSGLTRLNGNLLGTDANFSGNVIANTITANAIGYKDGTVYKDVATEINALHKKNGEQDLQLSSLEGWKTGVDSDLSSLKNRVTNLESWRNVASNTLSNHESRLNALEIRSGGSGDVTLVYDGYLQYGSSVTFTKKTFLTITATAYKALQNCSPASCANSMNTVTATAAYLLTNNCRGSNTESNTANGNVSVSSQITSSCIVNPGTYTLQKNGSTGSYTTYYANYSNLVTITASYIE